MSADIRFPEEWVGADWRQAEILRLLSDEVVEEAARADYEARREEQKGPRHDPVWENTFPVMREYALNKARVILTAALDAAPGVEKCERCGGSGQIESYAAQPGYELRTCPECEGKRGWPPDEPCPNCDATGTVLVEAPNPAEAD